MPQGFESGPAPDASGIFEDERRIAEAMTRGARASEVRGLHLEMRADLLLQLRVDGIAAPPATQFSPERGHVRLLYAGSMT